MPFPAQPSPRVQLPTIRQPLSQRQGGMPISSRRMDCATPNRNKPPGSLGRKPPHYLTLPVPHDDNRRESVMSTNMDELTDTMVRYGQALCFMGAEEGRPLSQQPDPTAVSQMYLDSQQKFMAVAKKRAATQEHFLTEAEEMKGTGSRESHDLVSALRSILHKSPLLQKPTENLMGRSAAAPPTWRLDPPADTRRPDPTARVMAKRGRTLDPIRCPASKDEWRRLLNEQEEMHTQVQRYDERYKAVMAKFVESEKSAFGRLMGTEAVAALPCLDAPMSPKNAPALSW
eukprot:EG_transcript_12054